MGEVPLEAVETLLNRLSGFERSRPAGATRGIVAPGKVQRAGEGSVHELAGMIVDADHSAIGKQTLHSTVKVLLGGLERLLLRREPHTELILPHAKHVEHPAVPEGPILDLQIEGPSIEVQGNAPAPKDRIGLRHPAVARLAIADGRPAKDATDVVVSSPLARGELGHPALPALVLAVFGDDGMAGVEIAMVAHIVMGKARNDVSSPSLFHHAELLAHQLPTGPNPVAVKDVQQAL